MYSKYEIESEQKITTKFIVHHKFLFCALSVFVVDAGCVSVASWGRKYSLSPPLTPHHHLLQQGIILLKKYVRDGQSGPDTLKISTYGKKWMM